MDSQSCPSTPPATRRRKSDDSIPASSPNFRPYSVDFATRSAVRASTDRLNRALSRKSMGNAPFSLANASKRSLRQRAGTGTFLTLDYFKHIQRSTNVMNLKSLRAASICARIYHSFTEEKPAMLIFLLLLGIMTAMVATCIDVCVHFFWAVRKDLVVWYSFPYDLIALLLMSIVFALMASLCVHIISRHSVGSGIPEMKSILGGVSMKYFLSLRTLLSKCLGLVFGLSAGLNVGKEGPFVHIASTICEQLLRIPMFEKLSQNAFIKTQMLATACAAGVAATFGAPLGGVFFSIEVTATYYLVSNLWKGVFSATGCAMLFFLSSHATKKRESLMNLFRTSFPRSPYDEFELPLFAVVGVLAGILGLFFIFLIEKLLRARAAFLSQQKSMRRLFREYFLVTSVAIICCTVTYAIPYMRVTPMDEFITLFYRTEEMDSAWDPPLETLTIFVGVQIVLVLLSIVLPIPVGLFAPVLMLGGGLGRLVGEFVKSHIWMTAIPGCYAVVGSAALASGVTHTLSTSIIIFELTGQMDLLIPALIATVAARAVAGLFSDSVYDVILRLRGLPYLRELKQDKKTNLTVRDIMIRDPCHLSMDMNTRDLYSVLISDEKFHFSYPIVRSRNNLTLVGTVQRADLELLLEKCLDRNDVKFPVLHHAEGENQEEKGDVILEDAEDVESVGYESDLDVAEEEVPQNMVKFILPLERETKRTTTEDEPVLPSMTDDVLFQLEQHPVVEKAPESIPSVLSDDDLDGEEVVPATFTLGGELELEEYPKTELDIARIGDVTLDVESGMDGPLGLKNCEDGTCLRLDPEPENTEEVRKEKLSHLEKELATVFVECVPFQIPETIPLPQLHFMFSMLGISHVFVTREGKLVGVISKREMLKHF